MHKGQEAEERIEPDKMEQAVRSALGLGVIPEQRRDAARQADQWKVWDNRDPRIWQCPQCERHLPETKFLALDRQPGIRYMERCIDCRLSDPPLLDLSPLIICPCGRLYQDGEPREFMVPLRCWVRPRGMKREPLRRPIVLTD